VTGHLNTNMDLLQLALRTCLLVRAMHKKGVRRKYLVPSRVAVLTAKGLASTLGDWVAASILYRGRYISTSYLPTKSTRRHAGINEC